MIRNITILLVLFAGIAGAQIKKPVSQEYLSILEKDTFYFFLSNERLLELSSSGNSVFYFVDEIKGSFNISTSFAVNEQQLLLVKSDTVSVYSHDSSGKFTLVNKQQNIWDISSVDPWFNDFIIHANGFLKIFSCNKDSFFIKDIIANDIGQFISYPYLVKEREIYKYVPGFGYYLVYFIPPETDPGILYWKGHKNCIIYHTWYQSHPSSPPSECSLNARELTENFPYYLHYSFWGIYNPLTYSTSTTVKAISFKYVILNNSTTYMIVNLNGKNLLVYYVPKKFYPSDRYLFNYDNQQLTFTEDATDSLVFHPLVYQIITGLTRNPVETKSFELLQNYPNPFNSSTKIPVSIPVSSLCTIKIYDLLGNELEVLLNEVKEPGKYDIEFDASGLSSGVYFYSVSVSAQTINHYAVKKMILLK